MEYPIVAILFGSFLVLLLIGAPITVSLAVSALACFWVLDIDPVRMVQIAYTSVGSFPLMALPAFVLAGALMEAAGISRRLVDIAEALAGPVTGGLGMATVLACVFFGAISGSGPATTAAVGMLMVPAMTRRGYAKAYAGAVTAASGGIGIIKGAKHAENAKKFLDFVMSRRVHERLGVYERRSTRADVTAPTNLPTLAEIHSTRFDARHAAAFRDEFLSEWRAAVIK